MKSFNVLFFIMITAFCTNGLIAQKNLNPDLTVTDGPWKYGWGVSTDIEDFTAFVPAPNDPRTKWLCVTNIGNYFSIAQNITVEDIVINNITYPAKSKYTIVLHPSIDSTFNTRARFIAPKDGTYNFNVIWSLLDKKGNLVSTAIWSNSGGEVAAIRNGLLTTDESTLTNAFSLYLSKGQWVSFEVGNAGAWNNDSTGAEISVEETSGKPDITVRNDPNWAYGWAISSGEELTPFKDDFKTMQQDADNKICEKLEIEGKNDVVERLSKDGSTNNYYWSIAQNTTNIEYMDCAWINYPPTKKGVLVLHPGNGKNTGYVKAKYTVDQPGDYRVKINWAMVDKDTKGSVAVNVFLKRQMEVIKVIKDGSGVLKLGEKINLDTAEEFKNLKKGDLIIFQLDNNDGDFQGDSTVAEIEISKVD